MKILDRLPISGERFTLDVAGQPFSLKPYQIIVQGSISNLRKWDARTPIVPALLDTGLNHNFSIQERSSLTGRGSILRRCRPRDGFERADEPSPVGEPTSGFTATNPVSEISAMVSLSCWASMRELRSIPTTDQTTRVSRFRGSGRP